MPLPKNYYLFEMSIPQQTNKQTGGVCTCLLPKTNSPLVLASHLRQASASASRTLSGGCSELGWFARGRWSCRAAVLGMLDAEVAVERVAVKAVQEADLRRPGGPGQLSVSASSGVLWARFRTVTAFASPQEFESRRIWLGTKKKKEKDIKNQTMDTEACLRCLGHST